MATLGPFSPQYAINSDYLSRLLVADQEVTVGSLGVFTFKFSGTATSTLSITVSDKFEVLDVLVRKDGVGAGNTVQVKNNTTAISDAIAFTTDKAVTRAGTIDTTQNVVPAGGTLACTATFAAGTVAGLVAVIGIIRP